MRRSSSTLALAAAVAAALALTACGAASDDQPGTVSEPAFSSVEPVAGSTTEADVDLDAAAVDGERRVLASCESELLDAFAAEQPERGRIDDQVQVYEAMQMLLPTAPTCGISHLQDDGRRLVVMAWFDAPETGPAVIAGLEAQGWSASAAPAAGYDTTTLTDGSASVEVHPIGLDNQESGIGQRWGGVDATMITVLLP